MLTKRFLLALREGDYLVSNVTDDKACPLYEGPVSRQEVRDHQWEKIKLVGCLRHTPGRQF